MSTMYDALRKAEMERKRASGGTVPAESGIAAHTGAMPDNIKIVLLLAAVAAVFGIALYRFMAVRDAFKPAKPAMRAANTLAPAAPAVPVPAAPQVKYPPGTYTLEGVVDAGPVSMAIINGKLLKMNDVIDDLIVRKVSAREVELSDAGGSRKVILKLQP